MYSDLRQTKNYSSYMKSLGWEVDGYKGTYIYYKKLLFWKFVKIQRPNNLTVKEFNSYLLKKYKHSTIYIESDNNMRYEELLKVRFRKYNSPFLPSKTVQLDLSKSEEQLLKEMHYKTRYNIIHNSKLKTQNSKLRTDTSGDIERFADFWQECAKKRGMFLSQKTEIKAIYKAFGKDAEIHLAVGNENDWLSAILRISTENVSYYMYAASTKEGKSRFAPTEVAWDAIKSAKKEGKKVFDFEGVYDERFPLKEWKGFTRFKKGFGGVEVSYPGTLRKVIF